MPVTTQGIVLSALKFKESSLIVSCYTKEFGIQSYILHHIYKAKKGKINPAYFQLLSQLEMQVDKRPNQTLHKISEVRLLHHYNNLQTNIYKSTVVMFLAEVLQNVLKEEEANPELYNFLESSLLWFDINDFNANFHLVFLLKLSQHLGIAPDRETVSQYFFTAEASDEKIKTFITLLGTNFDTLNNIKLNAQIRQAILNEILQYFDVHLGIFKKPKSLEILHKVFN